MGLGLGVGVGVRGRVRVRVMIANCHDSDSLSPSRRQEEKEKQRIKDIRAKGLDKLDLSYREMLEIPPALYHGASAQVRNATPNQHLNG